MMTPGFSELSRAGGQQNLLAHVTLFCHWQLSCRRTGEALGNVPGILGAYCELLLPAVLSSQACIGI
jgi:hypothetical protein